MTFIKYLVLSIMVSISSISYSNELPPSVIAYENFGQIDNFIFGEDDNKKFEVLYFFSYSCSACYSFKEVVKGWSDSNIDSSIKFKKIPVIFKDYWAATSKLFFIANGLKINIDDTVYDYFHKEKKFIIDDESIIKYFSDVHKIESIKVEPYINSHSVQNAMDQAMLLADKFEILGTPSFVVIDENKKVYKVSHKHSKSDLGVVATLTYLVKPELRKLLTGEIE